MECRFCEKMKRQHSDYNFCPYCGKPMHGEVAFIPSTVFRSSTGHNKVQHNLTYWHNIKN